MFDLDIIKNAIQKSESTKLSDVVEHKGSYYFVDSCYTLDHGYETMIFPCDKNGNVTDWGELYCEIYDTESEMICAHNKIVTDIGSVLD